MCLTLSQDVKPVEVVKSIFGYLKNPPSHMLYHGLQKIELDTLGPYVINPVDSTYSSICREHAGTKLSHVNDYWGNYGHTLLFAFRVNSLFKVYAHV